MIVAKIGILAIVETNQHGVTLMTNLPKPLFSHDCDNCVHCGNINGEDIYFCPAEESVIRRFGEDGDFHSMPIKFAAQISSYHLACHMIKIVMNDTDSENGPVGDGEYQEYVNDRRAPRD